MTELIRGLKPETIEKLSALWADENFKELVKLVHLTRDKYAKLCLTRSSWDEVQKLQWEATGMAIIIKTVEESYKKLNKEENANK